MCDQVMQSPLEPHAHGKRLFQRPRHQPGHLRAIRRVIPHPHDPARFERIEDFHSDTFCFTNQFVSRQRPNAMRVRCSITHKLFSEMLSSAQVEHGSDVLRQLGRAIVERFPKHFAVQTRAGRRPLLRAEFVNPSILENTVWNETVAFLGRVELHVCKRSHRLALR